jgi:hypothetical protein
MQKDKKEIEKCRTPVGFRSDGRTPHPGDRMTGFQTLYSLPRVHGVGHAF